MAMEELSSLFCYQESVEELKQNLLYMTYELQSARIQVEEEVRKNKETMESTKQLLNLLQVAYKERDEAKDQLQKLLVNKLNSAAAAAPTTLSPESPLFNNFHGKSSSGVAESNSLSGDSLYDVVSPVIGAESDFVQGKKQIDPESEIIYNIAKGRPLPKQGKLLEAVMGAGPLLQTLMVAGPMPRWRNPPPLQPLQVPPVAIAGFDTKNQSGPSTTTGAETGAHLLKRPLNGLVPCASSLFLANSVLNFAAGAGGYGSSGGMCFSDAGVVFGSQMVPAPKRHRIQ